MKVVVQRVDRAKLDIDGNLHCSINKGILVLLGFTHQDSNLLFDWFCNKLINLRIFNDEQGKMNLSVRDVGGEIMLVSNFTLYGDSMRGFRPSYSDAMSPTKAESLYNEFVTYFQQNYPDTKIVSGVFGAMMNIELVNNGPVTIIFGKKVEKTNFA